MEIEVQQTEPGTTDSLVTSPSKLATMISLVIKQVQSDNPVEQKPTLGFDLDNTVIFQTMDGHGISIADVIATITEGQEPTDIPDELPAEIAERIVQSERSGDLSLAEVFPGLFGSDGEGYSAHILIDYLKPQLTPEAGFETSYILAPRFNDREIEDSYSTEQTDDQIVFSPTGSSTTTTPPADNSTLNIADDFFTLAEDVSLSANVATNDSTASGGPLTYALETDVSNGNLLFNNDGSFDYTPDNNYNGSDAFSYTVTDAESAETKTGSVTLVINADSDLVANNDSFTINEDEILSDTVANNDSTSSGGTLSYALEMDVSNGNLVFNNDGSFDYLSESNFNGNDSFSYTVSDDDSGESSTQTVNLTVDTVADLTAADDSFSTTEDASLSDSVATNDNTTSGGSLSYALESDASNGSLVFNNDGSFEYTPDNNFNGNDSFTYTVSDADSDESSTQTVNVTVDATADLTAAGESFFTSEDTTLSDSVAINDTTTSGGSLSYALETDASNGSLVVNNDGSFNYTPDSNFNGSDSFSYTVTDADSGESSTQTVNLSVNPVADLTAADDSFNTSEDITLSDNVAANDSTSSGGSLSYALETDASNGNLVFNNDGSFDYTPSSNFNGNDAFSYTVTDSASGETVTNNASITITASSDLTAADDSFNTAEDTTLSDSVATNDSTTSGGTLSYSLETDVSNGILVLNNDGSFDYTPNSNFNGSDAFSYTVTDADSGESSIQTVNLTIDAVADLAAADDSFSTNEDEVLSDSVATNDSTNSGGALTYALETDVSNGTLVFNNDGSFDYTPNSNFNGSDAFSYTVTDADSGESSIQTVNLTVDTVADLTAADDSFSTNEDEVLSDSVATNDSTSSGGLLTYALETDVSNGTLVFNNDGSFDYTPNSNFNGSDAFSYTVTDADSGESSIQTVNLTVDTVADLTAADDSFSTNEDEVLSDTVAINDSTTSGGSLSFALETNVSNGTLMFNNDGSFDYTPNSNFNGSDSFSYTVTDADSGESSTQTVNLTIDPVADLAAANDSFSTNEDEVLSDSVATNDTTNSGGALTYSLETDVSNGTLVFNNDGSFNYTPNSNFNGSDSFSYTVSDADSGESSTQTVNLTVDAVADLTAADDSFTTNEDEVLSDSVATNDSTSSGGLLTYALETDVSNGNLLFNNDGSFDYTPNSNFNGSDSFSYTVTDTDSGESSIQTVNLTVDAVTDLTAADDSFSTNEDEVLSDSVATNDTTNSGGALTYALETDVSNGALLFNNDGSFDYTPNSNFNGNDSFTYTVTDTDSGESSTQTVNLTVDAVADLTAADDSFTTNEDEVLSDSVATNDTTTSGGTLSYALETNVSNGSLVFNNDGSFDYTPNSNLNGNDSFTYTVTDADSGESSTQNVNLTVDPVADLTAADDSFTTNEDETLSDTVAGNDSTTSGGTLSFALDTDVSNGILVFNNDGTFDYTPDASYTGGDTFTYIVSDVSSGESSTQTVNLTIQAASDLIASDDNFITAEDSVLNADVSTNDSTNSGGSLTFALDASVSSGTLTFDNDGTFTYTPDSNYNGSDSFSYTVTDNGSGQSSTQTVNLTVDAVVDLTAADDSFNTAEDTTLSDSVATNDSTTSGGSLSFALDTNVSNGILVLNNDGSFDYTPNSNFNGSDSFTYTVTDADSGESSTQTVNLTVDAVADLTAADDSFTTNEDEVLSDSVATNDSTSSGGSLSYALETDVSNGNLLFNNDGSFDYTPNSNFNGNDSFSYTVTDANSGESSTQTVNLTVAAVTDLTAAGDSFSTNEDEVLSDSVASNDTTTSGGSLSYALETNVSNGNLVFNNDGSFDYTPNRNFNGSDTFSYTVTDADSGESSTQTVNLTVDAVADLTAADESFTSNEDETLSDTVATNDSTTSGGSLSYALETDVSNGTLVLNNDGSFDYTPNSNFNGSDAFSYTVTDADSGESSTQTVNLTIGAVADLAATDDSFSTNEDEVLSDSVATNDTTTSGGTLSYALETNVSNGSLVFNNDGSFDYTPNSNVNGSDAFSYTVTDTDSGESSTQTVNLTVDAVADLTAADESFTSNEDETLSDTVATNDSTTSGGSLSYALETDVSNGTLVFNNDGSFDYTPNSNFNGNDAFSYTVTDADSGESSTQTVNLTINQVADLAADDDSFSTNEDEVLSDSVATNDSTNSGGALTYSLETDVSNGTLVLNNDGSFDYTPNSNFNGSDSFSYTVTDADSGESSTQTVNLTIDPVADLAAADDSFSTNEDEVLSDSVATNDSTSSGGSLTYALETDVSNGNLLFNNDGSFDYTPNSNFNGSDAFSYTVTDADSGESSTQTVNLTVDAVADLAAADDSFSTNEDEVLSDSVATNDSTTSGGSLSYGLETDVSSGNLVFNNDGSFDYTPNSNFNGNDSFTYTVTDANSGESDTRTVSLSISAVNDAATASDETAFVSETNLPGPTSHSGSFTLNDVDGDSLSVALAEPADSLFSNGEQITWLGDNSQTLVGSADGSEIIRITINDDGVYTVTLSGPIDHALPNQQDNESIDFTITVDDGTTTTFGNLEVTIEDDIATVTESYTLFSISSDNLSVSANVLGPSGRYGGDGGYVKTIKIGGAIFNYDPETNSVSQTGLDDYITSSNFNDSTFVLTINTAKGETLEVNVLSADYTYTASGQSASQGDNVAPVAAADDSSLLGIVSANALNLIDLSANQTFTAFDQNKNIESVEIRYEPLLGVGAFTLDASSDIAAELGLQVSIVNDPGFIGLIAPSSVLTITALDGGPIDNMPINELLATVILNETGINADVLSAMTITVTDTEGLSDSAIAADLANANLLGSNSQPDEIVEGDDNDNIINANGDDNRVYAFDGNDTVAGGAGNDLIRGGAGSDTLSGNGGNDILIGGSGNDQLTGGTGVDVFRWEQGDETGGPNDTLTDFDTASLASGGDIIDLSSILQGEGSLGDNPGNLTNFLHFELSGNDTILYISVDGNFIAGFNPANTDQQITFDNVDLVTGFSDDQAIIVDLLSNDKLIVDTPNTAPVAAADDSSLLGIVSANALNLIDLSANQTFTAFDQNKNIESVEIRYEPLLGVGAFTLDASADIAAELGLQVSIVNDPGFIGLIAPSSVLTITALDGGPIDNMPINELLATVILNETGINADVLSAMTITVTDTEGLSDSAIAADLANANLLGSNSQPDEIVEGDDNDNIIIANGDDNRVYAFDGNDTVAGGAGNDLIRGGAGSDTLSGNSGNDILIGGSGNDQLTGGTGVDVFRWEQGDETGEPNDTLTDFNTASLASGGDIIDLSSILQGEGSLGDNPGNLTNFLHFELSGNDTILHISVNGDFEGNFNVTDSDQQITFENVDLVTGASGDQGIIASLLGDGKLMVDEADSTTSTIGGYTDVDFEVSDNDGDTANTTVRFDSSGDSTPPDSDNVAPDVQASDSALLGLVGLSALNLLELGNQDINAADRDGNLRSVQIQYKALVGLGAYTLSASTALATELDLELSIVNDPGILGLVAPSSTLTITAADNSNISNLAINELLASVEFHDGGSLIPPSLLTLNVLNATTISAEDAEGLSSYDSVASLVDINALDSLDGNDSVIEGTSANDSLSGTAGHDRLYGYDGDDNLSGLAGNDLLRGGAGNDTLNGGNGHDLLLGGQGNDTLTGGEGQDFFMWEQGDDGDAVTPAVDTITDFDTDEGDALHLGDLLQGEDGGDLSQYLDFAFDGEDTMISVSADANGDTTQNIVLENTDITGGGTLTDTQIINNLLADGNLITD